MPRVKRVRHGVQRTSVIVLVLGFIAGVLIGIICIAAVYLGPKQLLPSQPSTQPAIQPGPGQFFQPSADLIKTNVLRVSGATIIIGHDCMAIVAQTSPERADAIEVGILNRTPERPTIYDSFVSALQAYNITLEAVVMYKFENDVYYSDAYFSKGAQVLQLDMKPSDGIALALRAGAPIYINRTMLQSMGRTIC